MDGILRLMEAAIFFAVSAMKPQDTASSPKVVENKPAIVQQVAESEQQPVLASVPVAASAVEMRDVE